ncbi:MAG: orotate phosphoribosyltransferase [Elusimicrobiota bacterium]|jgi:orotate phosphoribosyltransferase|nr:orotate phosphoribosyltransferase [Elusimicrobiota bacterium]
MTNEEVLQIFKDCGALLEGHFKLSSGLHSGKYLQSAKVLQYPDIAQKLCKELAAKLEGVKIDVVIGPAMGGVVIGYEMARALGVRGIFTERVDGAVQFRRGFELKPGERCLIAEDVVTTGKSTKEVMAAIKEQGALTAACCSLIDRSGGAVDFGVPLASMAQVEVATYDEAECPMCKAGQPLAKPGSRVFK